MRHTPVIIAAGGIRLFVLCLWQATSISVSMWKECSSHFGWKSVSVLHNESIWNLSHNHCVIMLSVMDLVILYSYLVRFHTDAFSHYQTQTKGNLTPPHPPPPHTTPPPLTPSWPLPPLCPHPPAPPSCLKECKGIYYYISARHPVPGG